MAAGVTVSDRTSHDDARYRRLLLALCALVFALVLAGIADVFGLGDRPWYGYADAVAVIQRSFVLEFQTVVPHGAAARAGLRRGDQLDLRAQDLDERVSAVYSPSAARQSVVSIRRGSRELPLRMLASSVWEVQPRIKLPPQIAAAVTNLWFWACAVLITLRASQSRAGRTWALILLGWSIPTTLTAPQPLVTVSYAWLSNLVYTAALTLFVWFASSFGVPSRWRRILEWCAYGAVAAAFVPNLLSAVGTLTLWFDPLPYSYPSSWQYLYVIPAFALPAVAVVAIAYSPRSERSRATWLLLPLPVSIGVAASIEFAGGEITSLYVSWYGQLLAEFAGSVLSLIGAAVITYALLKRRVLDFGFVLNHTIVVAIVSLIVVAAFVLLEWLLSTVIAGISHATSLIANAVLALGIGVSLGYIHTRVDAFVDATLFRKRHEDERALLNFSKEAAYVTNLQALLDAAIGQIEHHTDARNAAILLDERGSYAAVRSFGDGVPAAIDENDGAILALKAWHKPLDPHHYSTALHGALALPMLARGRLIGVMLSGEREGGEAYAPDEIEALSQFAHGVGSALDSLATGQRAEQSRIVHLQEQILDELRALPAKIGSQLRR